MIESFARVIFGLGLYFFVCVAAILAGRGILRLLNLDKITASLLLAPVLGLVFWSLGVGLPVAFRVPVKNVWLWLWGLTIILALIGMPSRRADWNATHLKLLVLCLAIPVATMPFYFLNGLTDYLGSIPQDGWSYVAFGQYIYEFPRGVEGGLAPLYQYAAHLSNARFISSALLAFFSPLVRVGDTQPVSSLFQAWGLYSISSAVAFFLLANKINQRTLVATLLIATSGGWMMDLLYANNFDNQIALVYMPAIAGLAAIADTRWNWWILFGVLVAGVLYSYPEMAFIILAAAVLIALPRFWQERHSLPLWLPRIGLALIIAAVLLLPFAGLLTSFFQSQFASTISGGARAGEGAFAGLTNLQFQPSAFWGLGGEYKLSRFNAILNVIGIGLSVLAALGLIEFVRQRRWGFAITTGVLTLSAVYYIVAQNYSYGAYKLITINWWCLAWTLVVGAEAALARLIPSSFRAGQRVGLTLMVGGILLAAQITSYAIRDPRQSLDAVYFRQVLTIKPLLGESPVRVAVDDWRANEWAVYYLRDTPMDLAVYRDYMAQAHVIPYMQRAAAIDLNAVRYVLTDANMNEQDASVRGWQKKWMGGPYALWQMR